MKQSMLDVANELLGKKKKPVSFVKLWEEVSTMCKLTEFQCEEYIADFYTDISLDGRFVNLGDNKWDLRARHKFNEVVIDTSELIVDDDEDSEEFDTDSNETEVVNEF